MKKISLFLLTLFTFSVFAQQKSFKTEEIVVSNFLKGTLYTPENSKKTNLVILIAGSGPTDRNGNQPMVKNNSLKFLAEGLAKNGISVYSYDKRFFAMLNDDNFEDFDESSLDFNDFIDDAADIVSFFKKDKKYKKVIVAGHSEGSLVGMIACQKTKADGFVSISGAGNPIDVVLESQIEQNAPFLLEESKSILSELKKGNKVEIENSMLLTIFRESVQPFMISWLKYNPQTEIQKLKIPIMITNGTSDLQVTVSEAEILQKAQPKATYLIIENMNHVLKKVVDLNENQKSYTDPDMPVAIELVDGITSFVKKI